MRGPTARLSVGSPPSPVSAAARRAPCQLRRQAPSALWQLAATAQRYGEPAWHRRRRKQRADARVILRIEAASRRLREHHSAQRAQRAARPAMPAGRNGGDGRGSEAADLARRFDILERMVLDLRGGTVGGKSGGGRGGAHGKGVHRGAKGGKQDGGGDFRGGTHGGGGKGAARGRPGDWACSACEAFPCFARTAHCYRCGAPKGGSGGGGGGKANGQRNGGPRSDSSPARARDRDAYLGPQGAGGSRPLLGGRGGQPRADSYPRRSMEGCPSVRTPGASLAAKAEAERRASQADRGPEPRDAVRVDEEGFQLVRGGVPTRNTALDASAPTAPPSSAPRITTSTSWAALSEEEEEEDEQYNDDPMGDGEEGEHSAATCDAAPGTHGQDQCRHDGDADDYDHDATDDGVDEGALKRQWMAYSATCRKLERDNSTPQQLIIEARAQRDQAEKRWRSARTPHPLYKRLRWAQAELREAEAKELAHRDELEAHMAQAARRTKELEERLRVDEARTARKRAAVEELHREGASGQHRPLAERAAIAAATGISLDVAPALLAAIEKLGNPATEEQEATCRELQLAAASLSRVEEVLRGGIQQPPHGDGPTVYDIGDRDDDDATCPRSNGKRTAKGGKGGTTNDEDDGKGRPPPATSVPRWTRASATGPWTRTTTSIDAVQEARRKLRLCSDEAGGEQAAAGDSQSGKSGATTNDLGEAERRDREAAQRQLQDALRTQGQQKDADQLQEDERARQQRDQRRLEELHRHQAEAQKAAEARAEEEEKQRQQLVASMSPEQLALAAELHAQQMAIGTKVFGSQEAAHMAGLAHQAHVQRAVQEAEERGRRADADHIMAMSPEDFAQWNRDVQEDW